jgi:hypothetical protein
MDKVKEQLYEALRDIRENNAGSNERARGWYNAPAALAAYEQEKAADPPCPACAMGQNLALGEGTHLEGTACAASIGRHEERGTGMKFSEIVWCAISAAITVVWWYFLFSFVSEIPLGFWVAVAALFIVKILALCIKYDKIERSGP